MDAAPAVLAPPPREAQRLGATIALSVLVHALLILGVGFAVKGDAPLVPTLEVIFSQTRTALTPKQADFLAAASQEGGGEHDRAQRPATTRPASCRRPRPASVRYPSSSSRQHRYRAAGAGGQQPQWPGHRGRGAVAPYPAATNTGCTDDRARTARC